MSKLRWYVARSREPKGWAVMRGVFCHGTFDGLKQAEEERDRLNEADGLTMKGEEI